MKTKIAQIAIFKPLHNLFDYEILEIHRDLRPGSRVTIEFGRKLTVGFVINVKDINTLIKKTFQHYKKDKTFDFKKINNKVNEIR